MIRFYDHIKQNPTAKEVEGKYVLATGFFQYRSFRKPGKVTRVSKNRVHIEPILIDDVSEEISQSKNFIDLRSIGAVCDTEDEARSVIRASLEAIRVHTAHQRACQLAINGLFNSLNEPESTDADERVSE